MRVLSIDPSSTSTGYAVMESPQQLIEYGRVTPDMALEFAPRLLAMTAEFIELAQQVGCEMIVIEIPAEQAPWRGRGARGQAKYGMSVGVLYARLVHHFPRVAIVTVQSDKWIRLVHRAKSNKAKAAERYRRLVAMFPSYQPKRDPKQDIADAIEMGWWFMSQAAKQEQIDARRTGQDVSTRRSSVPQVRKKPQVRPNRQEGFQGPSGDDPAGLGESGLFPQ